MLLREIRIKRNGKWYANDAEMFRRQILNILATHLVKNDEGQFYIHLDQDTFPVVVEDVPFLVVGAYLKNGSIALVFHDLQEMVVDRKIPVYFREDTPYITFKWEKDTRLDRSAFWMISDYLVESGNQVFLVPPQVQI